MIHKCPVCLGRGIVRKDFYEIEPRGTSTDGSMPVQCRACYGRGVILQGDGNNYPQYIYPYYWPYPETHQFIWTSASFNDNITCSPTVSSNEFNKYAAIGL